MDNQMMSFRTRSNLVQLNRKVENLLKVNEEMSSSIKELTKEMDEFKNNNDALMLIGAGASLFGSFLNQMSETPEDRGRAHFLRSTGDFAEFIGNATNVGVQLFDKFRTKVLMDKIKNMVEEYEDKCQNLSLELAQFRVFNTNRRLSSIRNASSASNVGDVTRSITISVGTNMVGIANKAMGLLDIIESSAERHPIIPLLQEMLENLELDSERIVGINNIITDSMNDPRSPLTRELINRINQFGSDYSEHIPSHSQTPTHRFNYK